MALPYPNIDPVIVQIGPFAVRWYAMAYLAGLIGGWRYMRWLVARPPFAMQSPQVDDFLFWATLGVVLGGRLGYVLFYKPAFYFAHPGQIPFLWHGGMSFHGGALGVILAVVWFARKNRLSLLAVGDIVATVEPIGQFFGRIANFINAELYGRPAQDLPWAMVFPSDPDALPRHPSQLYQAGMEGLALLIVMHCLWRNEKLRQRRGFLTGAFLAGYGVARIVGELFRQPDAHLGFLWGGATMGQLLSIPLVVAGSVLMAKAKPPA